MTVTVDELVLLIGKQAVELEQLRRQAEALRAELARREAECAAQDRLIEDLRAAACPKGGDR